MIGFLITQLVVLTTGLAWAAYRVEHLESDGELPNARNEPLTVRPLVDYPEVVSDEQLRGVLSKLVPRFRGKRPKINYVDHALRLWGIDATFPDPQCLSGREMRQLLLDHQQFKAAWGDQTNPLLIDTDSGIRVRVQQGLATSSHVDHTLAGLAEVGTPLSFPVHTRAGKTTVRALLAHSLREFSLNQVETEWSALSYALYLPPAKRWKSRDGQEITFDRLANRLMRQELSQGVCFGNHRLHALVVLLRADEQSGSAHARKSGYSVLSASTRSNIVNHLKEATEILVRNQHPEGYWSRSWAEDGSEHSAEALAEGLRARILATGHCMEWWALAPEELHPPGDCLVRAGQWLCRTIETLSDQQVQNQYGPLSHAGRALALWRARLPADRSFASGSESVEE